jgi:hypothetical protein
VTHRLDIRQAAQALVLEFEGLLDLDALAALHAVVAAARDGGRTVRIVLRHGTEVERPCVAALRALGAEVVAEAPYLARWLGGSR